MPRNDRENNYQNCSQQYTKSFNPYCPHSNQSPNVFLLYSDEVEWGRFGLLE